jgi:hypothetical protein
MKIMRTKRGYTRSIGIKMNICEDAKPILFKKGTYMRMRDPVGVKKERVCVIILSLPHTFILT